MTERFSIRAQYEEVELLYLEKREALQGMERRGKIPADQVPQKHRRLMKLRQARETLYRLAVADDGITDALVTPDKTDARENAA